MNAHHELGPKQRSEESALMAISTSAGAVMPVTGNSTGFAYQKKEEETPFETFLRYTDQKKQSAIRLADVIRKRITKDFAVLDVGTGNGEYLELALSQLDDLHEMALSLVEPSDDLIQNLEARFKRLLPETNTKIVHSNFQGFSCDERFDIILMSHLFYHIPQPIWTQQLTKALALLKPKGALVIVLREKDDAYDFKMTFKPLLSTDPYKAYVMDDVLNALPDKEKLTIIRHDSHSELKIPIDTNIDHTISIIEFYVNKQWNEIPEHIRQSALEFIKNKHGIFKQRDGIAQIIKY